MINKIEKKTVSDSVLDEMKRLIISGEWSEGMKIPSENELASMMGVSRVSVRSAIQRLSGIGLIESRQGGGTFVCKLDGSQNLNLLVPFTALSDSNQKYMVEFRRIIESEASYLAALRASENDIHRLWENLWQYQEADKKNYMSEECLELDVDFHMMVCQMTGNPMFTQLSFILKDTITENIRYVWRNTDQNIALNSHELIITAIESHEPEAARKAMWDHMDIVWELIRNAAEIPEEVNA